MKRAVTLIVLILASVPPARSLDVIRVNQLGYLPGAVKVAVLLCSDSATACTSFVLRQTPDRNAVFRSVAVTPCAPYGMFPRAYRLDFSAFRGNGTYFLEACGARSPGFRIGADVYDGTADVLLAYMRQQRSGYNPVLGDSCHTRDGYVIYGGALDSSFINVAGGWHDAADYLQYVTTSATAVFQLLFAYEMFPAAFGDVHDAAGLPAANGVPDVLDEARWGLDWLDRMNPRKGEMYNQIADDRDHLGFRLPTLDSVDYGFGRGRPVYACTGAPQGLLQHVNRSTGLASTAGKFASAFALGARIIKPYDPGFAARLAPKALDAYDTGKAHPGVCQTAPCRAPYFYEEENWKDDMQLAAASLFALTGKNAFLSDAEAYGREEGVIPWMVENTARHYQWYPFVNIGHYLLASGRGRAAAKQFLLLMRSGIERVDRRGREHPFRAGFPFIWCSNNYVSATLAAIILYRTASGERSYDTLEAAMRDWLFGCNPWGTSMVIGLPINGTFPRDPHSALSHLAGIPVVGGLVDGPVRADIFSTLKGVHLSRTDPFAPFQSAEAVYHDDWADYSTNEPTMDGTAGLVFSLAALASGRPAPAALPARK
jgi:hypothetical protein